MIEEKEHFLVCKKTGKGPLMEAGYKHLGVVPKEWFAAKLQCSTLEAILGKKLFSRREKYRLLNLLTLSTPHQTSHDICRCHGNYSLQGVLGTDTKTNKPGALPALHNYLLSDNAILDITYVNAKEQNGQHLSLVSNE